MPFTITYFHEFVRKRIQNLDCYKLALTCGTPKLENLGWIWGRIILKKIEQILANEKYSKIFLLLTSNFLIVPFYAKIGKKRLGKKWYSTFLCDIRRFFWRIIRRNLILQIKTSNIKKKNQYHAIYSTFFWLKFTKVESPFFFKKRPKWSS